jgi:arylesterase/paraoxonase
MEMANITSSSFFITNDHYFWGGFLGGVLRKFENKFGPWKWASDVVHCSASGSRLDCKTVSPTHSHPSANGALLIDDGKVLLVNDVVKGTTTFYDVDPVSKELTVKQEVVR